MEVSRLYNKEKRFLILVFSCTLVLLIGIIAFFLLKNRTSPIETAFEKSDYKALYTYIKNPDFTEEVFKAYMEYNFGNNAEVVEKNNTETNLVIKVKGVNETKIINFSKGKGYIWNFNDYIYNWTINASKGTTIYIEDQEYRAEDGIVEIPRIPFGVYDLKAKLESCSDYETNIMAGQNVQIKMELSPETLTKCNEVLREYLSFKEKAINTKVIGEISSLAKNSGLYKELVEEVEWLKKQDFVTSRKLINFEIKNGILDNNNIALNVYEKWEIYIKADENESTKNEEYNSKYLVFPGEQYTINQIKTINQ